MKRKLIAFSTTMALLLSVFSAANVGAFTATIDHPTNTASAAEWIFTGSKVAPPADAGIGIVQRNTTQQGAYIFNDASKDQRLITTTQPVTRETDIDFFGVTADATNVYFLTKVDNYSGIANNPALELLITVDTNQQSGVGTVDLPLVQAAGTYNTTKVANDAAWEFALRTTFTPGTPGAGAVNGTTRIHTNATGAGSTCDAPTCSSQLASTKINQGNFAEIKVAWSQIGGKPVNANYLRLTVSTLYNTHAVPADGYNSPVIDVLGIGSTLADLQDGTIDTSFDVHFDVNGEAYAPLMITEFQPNPIGTDSPGENSTTTQVEWIEVYNPNDFAIPLGDYKISNTPKRGSTSQGAVKFPAGSIAAKTAVVVAYEKDRFLDGNPGVPDALVYDLTADMTPYTAWAGGDLQLDNAPPTSGPNVGLLEEQVLLLDAKDGIVDMATYGNVTTATSPAVAYPGHTPFSVTTVPEGVSYERCPVTRDTNNSSVDFITHTTPGAQTPGVACLGVPDLDLTIAKSSPANPLKDGSSTARYVPYTITYSNVGTQPENAAVTVVDTLPAGLTFGSSAQPAGVAAPTVNGQALTWNIPAGLPVGASGTIVLTATVDTSVGQNVPLTNNVSISGPSELPTAPNPNTAQSTTTTLGPADTSISSNLSGSVPPGALFQFTITYRNTGQEDAEGVNITNVLPAGVTILSENSPTATWDNATTGTVTWDVGTLPVNGSGTIVVTAQLSSSAVIGAALPNALSITVPLNDPTPSDNSENKTLTVGLRKLYMPLQLR